MRSRRELLLSAGVVAGVAVRLRASPVNFRYSICNEIFRKRDFRESCKRLRSMSYTGLEIAPVHRGGKRRGHLPCPPKGLPATSSPVRGLTLSGMHWLRW